MPFIGSKKSFAFERQAMLALLREASRLNVTCDYPIRGDIHVQFLFYFNNFLTKKGSRNRKIPDLSNLYHFPEDCLQEAGIIDNDSFICSHDGSRRFQSLTQLNSIDITIWTFDSDAKQEL